MVRDADELHDALLTLILLPAQSEWRGWIEELRRTGRARVTQREGREFWIATERADCVDDAVSILRGWSDSIGPFTGREIAERLALPLDAVEAALGQLEAEGQILRGHFSPDAKDLQFCHRRILARIHRLTLHRLRQEIEPVTAAQFMRFLCGWQHVARGTQLHGVDGLFQVLRQLQGCEISAAAWESAVLPKRMVEYDPEWLDRLCLSGEVQWGRLSPHPALEREEPRRVRPTRVAPVALFLRADAAALLPAAHPSPALSHQARDIFAALESRGALFFDEILRITGRLASEVEDGLWELAAAGIVTADGFENLRSLIDPKRRRGEGRGRNSRPRHAAGRWALLARSAQGADPEFFAKQLLERWGVVFRDLLARESLAPAWRELLLVYRRMEARGEIRGGRFVSGFVGEQFARPEALDLLRHLRRTEPSKEFAGTTDAAANRFSQLRGAAGPVPASGELIEIAAADPLNLSGVVLPGTRSATLAQGALRLVDGVAQETETAWAV